MRHNTFLLPVVLAILAITGCNADHNDEKLFGFLRSAEKCLKEENPEACVKRNLNAWCEKKKENFPDANVGTHVCECIDDDSSTEEVRMCIKEKIGTYCEANMDKVKCKIFERCKGDDDDDDIDVSEKKECVKSFCEEPDNTDRFECLAFDCRENYSVPQQKLTCIKEACVVDDHGKICQKISECETKTGGGLLGKLRVFKCLRNSVLDGIDFD